MTDEAANRISKARTRLVLDRPFLGALALRMPIKAVDAIWCETVATDARCLYYNPEYFATLSNEQAQFALAHEVLHCAFLHFSRRGHRDRTRWDIACDYAINSILLEEGLEPVPGALFEKTFKGLSAEEIYPYIDHTYDEEPHDNHLYEQQNTGSNTEHDDDGSGQGKPPPLSQDELQELASRWQQRLAGAAQLAQQAGKLGGGLARAVAHRLHTQLPWQAVLARFISFSAREDYSYSRFSSRRSSDAIMPSLRSATINIIIALDTSGSVRADQLQGFIDEVNALHGQVRGRITLLACDAELAPDMPHVYEPWESFELPDVFHGGGGTAFKPVFEWVARQDTAPDLLIYFTDGEADFPDMEPEYPVIWLIKGAADVPWGQRIQLN